MNRWFFCLSVFFFAACSGKNDTPSGILPRDKMEKVIWDMIQADQYYREFIIKDSLSMDVRQERFKIYEQVFQQHKITRTMFDNSFRYYSEHPALMKDIFDSLSSKGNRRLQDFYKPAKTSRDSTVVH